MNIDAVQLLRLRLACAAAEAEDDTVEVSRGDAAELERDWDGTCERLGLGGVPELSVRNAMARASFASFVRQAWAEIDPSPLAWSWVLEEMCRHVEAVEDRVIKRLVVNIPPGFAKSMIWSVLRPAWTWVRDPTRRMLVATYHMDLTIRDAVKSRLLMASEWYQQLIGQSWKLRGDQNVKSRYENSKGGFRHSLSVRGMGTGARGDDLSIDDPHNVEPNPSAAAMHAVEQWWSLRMRTRFNDMANARIVCVMQRIHPSDLSAVLLEEGFEHLQISMEYDPEDPPPQTSIGVNDPRSEKGELAHPERFGPDVVKGLRKMGARAFAAQMNQKCKHVEGDDFQLKHMKFWFPDTVEPPRPVVFRGQEIPQEPIPLDDEDQVISSWDMAFKGTSTSSFVCGQVWRKTKSGKFLLQDQERKQMGFLSTIKALEEQVDKHSPSAVLIEDKANGPAVMETIKGKIHGVIPIEPKGSKHARAQAILPLFEGGDVWLMHPALAPWVLDWLEEHLAFPNGDANDQVDTTSQTLNHLRARGLSKTERRKRLLGHRR